ncbi:MAG: hypothetical protein RSF40_01605 [Oscillospiraceae bacterium]
MFNWWYHEHYWYNCVYGQKSHCVRDGYETHCPDCDLYLNKLGSVSLRSLPQLLQRLLEEHWGEMIFIEKDNDYSTEEVEELKNVLLMHFEYPLDKYIDFDFSGNNEVLVTIYEGIYSILFDSRQFVEKPMSATKAD